VDAASSYADWNERKQHPDVGKILSDLVYSCISGFEGRPFARHYKIRNEEASVDAEGQQILTAYCGDNFGWRSRPSRATQSGIMIGL